MIRRVQEADAEAIAGLEGELFPDVCWNEHTTRREIKLGWGVVDEQHRQIVGYLIARVDNDLTDIIRIGVAPKYQQRGIGRAMLKKAVEQVAGRLMLTVRIDNGHALRLYRSEGFVPVSHSEGSAILMRSEG